MFLFLAIVLYLISGWAFTIFFREKILGGSWVDGEFSPSHAVIINLLWVPMAILVVLLATGDYMSNFKNPLRWVYRLDK